MDKFERILEIPACYITREVANLVAERVRAIAEEQVNADYIQTLRQIAPSLNLTPDDAVQQYAGNVNLRNLLVVRKDRTTFISPHGNVQYAGRDVLYDEIPMDPSQVVIDITGINGKYMNISLNAPPGQVFDLRIANKILIQGADRDWVNGVYQEFSTALAARKKIVRDMVYRWLRPLMFLAVFALSSLEFRLLRMVRPDFTLFTPLTGLAVILVFLLFLVNVYVIVSIGGRAIQYLFPYFELEARLSERRGDLRKWWTITVIALYGSGLWAAVTMLVG